MKPQPRIRKPKPAQTREELEQEWIAMATDPGYYSKGRIIEMAEQLFAWLIIDAMPPELKTEEEKPSKIWTPETPTP